LRFAWVDRSNWRIASLAGYAPRWKFVAFDVGSGLPGAVVACTQALQGDCWSDGRRIRVFMKVSVFLCSNPFKTKC
jgi:hypothetical protein